MDQASEEGRGVKENWDCMKDRLSSTAGIVVMVWVFGEVGAHLVRMPKKILKEEGVAF